MPVRNLVVIFLMFIFSLACYFKADRNRYASTLAEAMNLIDAKYVEEVDQRELYENAMQGMAASLDPYSGYIGPSEYRQLQESLEQEFGGIGIQVELSREKKRLMVMTPLIDTPAYKAGIKAGDLIMSIDGHDTEGLTLKDAVELMRGKPGTTVTLSVLHVAEKEPVERTIQRVIIPIESVLGDVRRPDGSWDFQLAADPRITYVRVVLFGEQTAKELKKTLANRQHDALILDLRDNSGGLLRAAVETCDMFLDGGKIVSTRVRGGRENRSERADGAMILDKKVPIVVITNRFSASAAEIVAACLQDHGRAKVVGQRSFGKGTVQEVITLEGGRAALKLTTASYWRPSGKNIHRFRNAKDEDDWGVHPDEGFEVALTDQEADHVRRQRRDRDVPRPEGTKPAATGDTTTPTEKPFEDPQMRKAVEYLKNQLDSKSQGPSTKSQTNSKAQ